MKTLTLPLDADGATVELLVGLTAPDVRALRQAGNPVPTPISVRALVDTGAETTCIDGKALAPFLAASKLQPTQFLIANLPAGGGMSPVSQYPVSLTVVHPSGDARTNLVLRDEVILEHTLGPLGYQALLGRDVLARCLLVYDGPSATFTLAY